MTTHPDNKGVSPLSTPRTHPDILITKYLSGKLTPEEKDELLEHLLKFTNRILHVVKQWKSGELVVAVKDGRSEQ